MGTKQVTMRGLVSTLIAALTVTSLSIVLSSPASAAPATPVNLQASSDPIPTLSWDRVEGATKYTVQGAENPSFTNPLVFSVVTFNTSYVPVRVLKEGTLYWRVLATDNSGSSPYAESLTTIGTHLPPTGISIDPGVPTSPIMPPVEPPVISWDGVAGATSYDVEMDAEGDSVGGTVKTNIKTTTYVWPDPQGVGETGGTADFFVRVRAKFDNSLQTDWSEYVPYDVAQLPPVTYQGACPTGLICAPDPAGPATRPSIDVEDVVFDWDPIRGAKNYEIWISSDQGFSTNPVERRVVSGTRYSPKTSYDNASYYWKVRAINAAGEPTPWPATGSLFRRRWAVAPTLIYPPNSTSTVTGDLYFQWTPLQHATRYKFEIGTDSNFTPGTFSTCNTASTTFTVGYRRTTARVQWGARCGSTRAPCTTGGSAASTPRATTSASTPRARSSSTTGALVRVSPANGATVSVPTLRWGMASKSTTEGSPDRQVGHQLRGHRSSTRPVIPVDSEDTYALSWTTTQTLDPANSPFKWQSWPADSPASPAPLLDQGTFTYVAPTAGRATPWPRNPPEYGDSNARFPSLSWQPIANASYYKMTVYNSASFELRTATTTLLSTAWTTRPSRTGRSTSSRTRAPTPSASPPTTRRATMLGTTPLAPGDRSPSTRSPVVPGSDMALDGTALDSASPLHPAVQPGQPGGDHLWAGARHPGARLVAGARRRRLHGLPVPGVRPHDADLRPDQDRHG